MVTAIILASGFSKRMGTNKLLLPFNNITLIQHTLHKILECNFSDIILVARENIILDLCKATNINGIYNDNAEVGKSSSIKIGIQNSPTCQGYMFFTGDQPLLDTDTINLILRTFENNKDKIIVPIYKGTKGNPVIFPSKLQWELLALTGDNGGRDILHKYVQDTIFVEAKNEYALWDIDSPEDYQKLIKLQNKEENHVCNKKSSSTINFGGSL